MVRRYTVDRAIIPQARLAKKSIYIAKPEAVIDSANQVDWRNSNATGYIIKLVMRIKDFDIYLDGRLCVLVDNVEIVCNTEDSIKDVAERGAEMSQSYEKVYRHERHPTKKHIVYSLDWTWKKKIAPQREKAMKMSITSMKKLKNEEAELVQLVHVTLTLPYSLKNTISLTVFLQDYLQTVQSRSNTKYVQIKPKNPTEMVSWFAHLPSQEWGVYSQNGEDGILSALFGRFGTTNRYYVEFGVEDGNECNSRFLRESHGWKGLMMDGGFEDNTIGLYKEFVTAETINTLFTKHAVPREFDLLSIDIDYNDYWMWKAINDEKFSARIVVIEVNSHIPPQEARTVPYEATGNWDGETRYQGASVAAFEKIGREKGYTLVYCESRGVNCFFVRDDILGLMQNENPAEEPWNLSAISVQKPPNYFGRGWRYPKKEGEWKFV
eukprot:g4526.t1